MAKKTKVKAKVKKKSTKKSKTKALTLVPAPIGDKQLLFMLGRTPAEHISKRKAKGGGEWNYVTGVYFKKILNYVFGWMWDFQIIDKGREGDHIWVQGRLTINNKAGKKMIVKEQFGRSEVKYMRGKPHKPENMLDYGNDLKAATTDALKKCASELGIASDVYGKNEFNQIQREDKGFTPPPIEVVDKGKVVETTATPEPKSKEQTKKVAELRGMLKGNTDAEKVADLKRRTGIHLLKGFDITERHANVLIASVLNAETK